MAKNHQKLDDFIVYLKQNGHVPVPVWDEGVTHVDTGKSNELFFLYSFIDSLQWKITEIRVFEQPDFVLSLPGEQIGIELTQIFKVERTKEGYPFKESEAFRARFLMKVAEEYYNRGGPPIRLDAYLTRTNYGEDDILKIVTIVLLESYSIPVGRPPKRVELPYQGEFAYIKRLPDEFVGYRRGWRLPYDSTGWVGKLHQNQLIERVEEKAKKLDTYKKRSGTEDIILLIVVDRSRNSGMLNCETAPSIAPQGFKAVYLHDSVEKKSYRVG